MASIGISKLEGENIKKSIEEIKRYYATNNEISYFFNNEYDKKEYDDLNERGINGERFIYRNYLSDFYSHLTEDQKKFIAKFHVLLGAAIREDREDREYNLKNYDELNNIFFNERRDNDWKIKLR